MLVLAHVSDIHIDGSERNTARATRVLDHVGRLPVDAILLTGDIADHGAVEEYEIARGLIETDVPLVLCPGNHDIRENLRKVLLSDPGEESTNGAAPVNQVLRLPGATIALCDSSIPGRPDGILSDETLDWLDGVLAATPEVPAFVGMHHPAVPLGIPYVDEIRLGEPERLAAVLARHPQVVAVLAGHAHTGAATTFAGLPLLAAPGVVNTALLPFETGAHPPIDRELPPAVALHVYDEGRITTHYRPVG
ncbi:metallophosphoesterase [Microtetraspora sp. NBRC 16547]|uniref:metallophosphoesterase n=1 Tax=Microtetraspora sp. NBRC 16547 TaxID=3030993 RepID=UPI0024A1D1C0|nr:metallophosphoesterase [Microtetraspora sp. NBRC 16547]GLX01062.1 3',5'-cyclic adenosine monophosphate phosphodiesterase CpdA [Microtetraspora sp. NBRC 16547]